MSKKSKGKNKGFTDVKVISGVLIATACVAVFYAHMNKDTLNYDESIEEDTHEHNETNISTYNYDSMLLRGHWLDESLDKIETALHNIVARNGCVTLQLSEEDFEYYVYNNSGECVAQSSDGMVNVIFKNDGSGCIAYNAETGEMDEIEDIHIVDKLLNSIEIARNYEETGVNTVQMANSDIREAYMSSGQEFAAEEFRIDIKGEDAYTCIFGDGVAAKERAQVDISILRSQLVEQFGEVDSAINYEPHNIINYMIYGDNITIISYLVYEDAEYINWIINGYLELDEWSLPEEVYEFDISSANEDERIEITDLVTNEVDRVLDLYESKYSE